MVQKKFPKNSKLAKKLDPDNNGEITTEEELHFQERLIRLENLDAKEDQQRYMVWFSAISVTVYIAVLMTPFVPESRLDHLSSIGSTWGLANMGIIGGFIAGTAFSKKNGER
mgnify:CR=1 FL=1